MKWYLEDTGGHVLVLYSDVVFKDGKAYVFAISDELGTITTVPKKLKDYSIQDETQRDAIFNTLFELAGRGEFVFMNMGQVLPREEPFISEFLSEVQLHLITTLHKDYEGLRKLEKLLNSL